MKHARLLLAGAALLPALAGCQSHGAESVLGKAPSGPAHTVAEIQTLPKGTPVLLTGEMVEKCPAAGCWFDVRDKTGVVRVDTKAAGFVVLEVPLHKTVTVAGSTSANGDERGVSATGVRYVR